MAKVEDLKWKPNLTVEELVKQYSTTGFQSIQLGRATDLICTMKESGSKIFLTFTSNMVTSGLRGFFAQLIKLGMVDAIVTTVGGIEEDIMKAHGEEFFIGKFQPDDAQLHEEGTNRVGNLFIKNESYTRFEDLMLPYLDGMYKQKPRWTPSEIFRFIGEKLEDENSILHQAAKKDIPIFCPAITDGAMGFHLFMHQQKHEDFVVDVVRDFKNILFSTSHDDIKSLICLGGSISKHHAILACLLNGGARYALYMTTARSTSGSMSGATTDEAKSWGKVKDDADAVTVNGDVTINFPLAMSAALQRLHEIGLVNED